MREEKGRLQLCGGFEISLFPGGERREVRDKLILGSRGSVLALWQANFVAQKIKSLFGVDVEIKKIKTKGDKILDSPLARIGGKGLFVKEIEMALEREEIDLAVHSMKDVPTELPSGLTIGAVIEREDPRDALISRSGVGLEDLPLGAVVGTSSLRRKAQLWSRRPDLKLVDLRGNLDTRLRKLEKGQFEAMIVAFAGVKRLGRAERVTEVFGPETMLPAVGQGALAVEIREDDERVREIVSRLDHKPTRNAVFSERALMRALEGGCQVPVGALASIKDGELTLQAMIASLDGKCVVRGVESGNPEEAEKIGYRLAERLLSEGGKEILAEIRKEYE
jgi:hydroxymethylbilane synthase